MYVDIDTYTLGSFCAYSLLQLGHFPMINKPLEIDHMPTNRVLWKKTIFLNSDVVLYSKV